MAKYYLLCMHIDDIFFEMDIDEKLQLDSPRKYIGIWGYIW